MFDPFVVQQAYIVNYTLAFLPALATDPDALHPAWRPVSAFVERRSTWQPRNLVIPRVGELSSPPDSMWAKCNFAVWPRPWVIKTDAWRFEWLPDVGLPSGSNPSTRLYIHIYPLGVVSIALATAVGFGGGIEIAPFARLLQQMTPQEAGGKRKPNWLCVVSPEAFAGMEVNLDSLAEVILGGIQDALFESPAPGQVVRMQREEGDAHLHGHHGGIIDLVRTAPQRFDRASHAAGFRGIVTMRPNWTDIVADRLEKYRDASTWTGRPGAWHYAGGLNTALGYNTLPESRRRRWRRGYTWRVAAMSELARLEKALYQYSREFVVTPAHDTLLKADQHKLKQLLPSNWPGQFRLKEWKRFWLKLADAPWVVLTGFEKIEDEQDDRHAQAPDLEQAYVSHAASIKTNQARDNFRKSLEKYSKELEEYSWLGGQIGEGIKDLAQIISALGTISKAVSTLGRLVT